MTTMRKVMVAAAGAALALVVVSVVVLRNASGYLREHRDWVSVQASNALGRPVTFGDVGVSVWGGLGARITDLRIGEAPAFASQNEDFVRVDSVRVVVRLLPALFGRYEVRRLVLEQPRVHLVWTKAGLNAADRGGGDARGGGPAEPGPESRETGGGGVPPLVVGLLAIRDGTFRLVDHRGPTPAELTAEHVDLTVSDFGVGRRAQVELSAAVLGAERANVSVEGSVGPLAIDADPADAPFDVEIEVTEVDLDALARGLPLVRDVLPAPLAVGGAARGAGRVARDEGAARFEMDIDATAARLDWGDLLSKPAGLRLEVAGQGTQEGTTLRFDSLRTRLADLVVTGDGSLGEALAMRMRAEPVSLEWTRVLRAVDGIDLGGVLGFDLGLGGRPDAPAVSGSVDVRDVVVTRPGGPRVEGVSTTLTLADGGATMPATTMRVDGLPVEVTLRIPKLLDAQASGTLRSPGGSVRGVTIGQLEASWSASPTAVEVRDVVLQAWGGRYDGRVTVDWRNPAAPAVESTSRVQGMNVNEVLAVVAPQAASQVAGRVDGQLDLTGTGATPAALSRSLRGQGRFSVADGALRGVNLAERVLGGVTGLPGLASLVPAAVRTKYPDLFGGADTRFDELRGDLRLAAGTGHLERLVISARDYRIGGDGRVALASGALEAKGVLTASEGLTRDMLKGVKEVSVLANRENRLEVPFTVSGTWPEVSVRPDSSGLLRSLQRGLIEQGIGELLGGKRKKRDAKGKEPEPVPSPGDELIRKGLDRLFGR
jgi:hypothetical protein